MDHSGVLDEGEAQVLAAIWGNPSAKGRDVGSYGLEYQALGVLRQLEAKGLVELDERGWYLTQSGWRAMMKPEQSNSNAPE